LQFKFEFVGRSEAFPLGVKTSYRAFCCDEVIELTEVFTENPLDSGFQPVLTEVTWQPDHRQEAFEILTDIPNGSFISHGFINGSRTALNNTIHEVEKYFSKRLEVIREWHAFDATMPNSDLATPFAIKHGLHIPLQDILFGVQVGFDSSIDVQPIVSKSRKQQYNEKDLPRQKSTASVNHKGNKGKVIPKSRISLDVANNIVLTEEEKLSIMCTRVQSLTVKDLTAAQLKLMCQDANLLQKKGLSNKLKMLEA